MVDPVDGTVDDDDGGAKTDDVVRDDSRVDGMESDLYAFTEEAVSRWLETNPMVSSGDSYLIGVKSYREYNDSMKVMTWA